MRNDDAVLTREELRQAAERALVNSTPEMKRALRDPRNAAVLDTYLESHAAYVSTLGQTQSEDVRALTAAYVLALGQASPYTAESAKRISEAARAFLEAMTASVTRVSGAADAYADAYNALLLGVMSLAVRPPARAN